MRRPRDSRLRHPARRPSSSFEHHGASLPVPPAILEGIGHEAIGTVAPLFAGHRAGTALARGSTRSAPRPMLWHAARPMDSPADFLGTPTGARLRRLGLLDHGRKPRRGSGSQMAFQGGVARSQQLPRPSARTHDELPVCRRTVPDVMRHASDAGRIGVLEKAGDPPACTATIRRALAARHPRAESDRGLTANSSILRGDFRQDQGETDRLSVESLLIVVPVPRPRGANR